MTSPCGNIRIPINEEGTDEKGQIQEYLDHTAAKASSISPWRPTISTARSKRAAPERRGVPDTPETYYELLDRRLPNHGEDVSRLQKNRILLDGAPGGGLLLQIFTENQIGPIFFEIIQRKGNDGFGEGNFKALFESIELDQMRRGVLKTVE